MANVTTMMVSATAREAQRVAHLVLGQPRAKPAKGARRSIRKAAAVAPALADGIEERVQLLERWSHKANGTAETHEHVSRVRPGAIARLHASGAIDAHQLAAADEIATAYQTVTADVTVRTAKYERGSGGGPEAASAERIGQVIRERAYTAWRAAVAPNAAMLLAVIVDDVALTIAARRWRMSDRRARRVLVDALDRWRSR